MIEQALLDFLKELAINNNKEWFDQHKPRFTKLDTTFKKQMDSITDALNEKDVIEKLKVFRIYRDVRFSNDKTPFKTHRSANWMRAGANRRGSYYLSIGPDQCVIGIGFFGPEKDDLYRVRKEIEMDAVELRAIIEKAAFKKTWGVFQGESLKVAPKGFDKSHPDIDLIRLKNFFFTKKFTIAQVTHADFEKQVINAFETTRPFLDYMTAILTTNLNGESLIASSKLPR